MKRVSDKMKVKLAEYRAQVAKDDIKQVCALCGAVGTKRSLERHHPRRRLGKNLFIYEYVCQGCHREIEDGKHPELLPRDNSSENRFHGLREGENLLKGHD